MASWLFFGVYQYFCVIPMNMSLRATFSYNITTILLIWAQLGDVKINTLGIAAGLV